MKAKLSALTLAMMPVLAYANVANSNASQIEYASDSLIVVYKEDATPIQKKLARQIVSARISDFNRDEIDDAFKNVLDGRIAQYKLDNTSVKDALEKLEGNPAILYAEPNFFYSPSVVEPNDALYGDLWGLNNTGQAGGVEDADIDAPEAWDTTTGSRDIVIGVIDSGVRYDHEDLIDNMWTNPGEIPGDGIDNDGNGYIDDIYGFDTANGDSDPMDDDDHGTHVSGTIGATGGNGIGVVGVNHEVSIAGCKFIQGRSGSTAAAIECINYFVSLKQNGVNVRATNNSWGGGGFSQALEDAIAAMGDEDILFLAAAGNDGTDNDAIPHYPSNYTLDNVVSVASIDRTDGDATHNFGATSVDLAAPGVNIVSTISSSTSSYAGFTGTSMATPHVTGAAALVWSYNPDLTALEMKELLLSSGDDNDWAQGNTLTGKRLNVNEAMILADPTPGFTMGVSPAQSTVTAGDSATYTLSFGNIADWEGEISLSLEDAAGFASLSSPTAMPGDDVTLTLTTADDTAFGDYEVTVNAVSGDLTRSRTVGLYVLPQNLNDFPYTSEESVVIPPNEVDPDDLGVDSIINIPDDLTVFGTSTYVNITHTYSGDLTLTLTSPSGTSAVLRSQSGGSTDDIDASYASDAFNGEVATGDWILNVQDAFNGDDGTLNNWSITITGVGEVGPAAPNAGFSVEVEGLTATFTDTSTDVNNDIVSWAWDFGDGASSTEQNPIHVFASTGSYDVTLTTTDSEGQSDSVTETISVSSSIIEASVTRALLSRFGSLRVDLEYTGSSAETVDIYRNGELIDTVENTGTYRDRERRAVGTSFTYMVCDETSACSDPVVAL